MSENEAYYKMEFNRLNNTVKDLEKRLKALEKDSHPPIDFIERIAEAINSGELILYDDRQNVLISAANVKVQ